MPTAPAACAPELLVVVAAETLCRLVVAAGFVEVEVPGCGSDVLRGGRTIGGKDGNA
jgi:hypothetical protein